MLKKSCIALSRNILLAFSCCFLFSNVSFSQCGAGQALVSITLTTDNFPGETTWDLKDINGNVLATNGTLTAATTTTTTVCVNSSSCLTFTIHDSYGDGICCAYGNGSYNVQYNGVTVAGGTPFTTVQATTFNCSGQQCGVNQSLVSIILTTDNYPGETTWDLKDNNGNTLATNGPLTAATTTTYTLCVDSSSCLTFTIHDAFGDGICCAYGTGSYTIKLDGVTQVTGGQFTVVESTSFNCSPGMSCTSAFIADTMAYTAPFNSTWYSFTPSVNGLYSVSTCDTNNHCDTKVWIYDKCHVNISTGNT